jgi:HD-like signal output (HDOD) protein
MPLPLRRTANTILQLIDDPYTNVSTIKKIVLGDLALCVRLLKHANSSTFSKSSEICSINKAIMVLGWRNIRGIIASASLPSLGRKSHIHEETFWANSACRSIACKEIANILEPDISDELSSIGLVFGVGKTVLIQNAPERYSEVILQVSNGFNFSEAEQTSLGFISPSLSHKMCHRWSLGKNIVSVLAELAGSGDQDSEVSFKADIVALADLLSLKMGYKQLQGYPDVQPQAKVIAERLKLDKSQIDLISERTERSFRELRKLLENH